VHHVHQEPSRPFGQRDPAVSRNRLVGRLEAEDAAEVRGNPQRSSSISPQLQRCHASSDRGRAATGAATRRTLEPMRIFALRIDIALHLVALEVGWNIRLAQNDCAARLESLDDHPVLRRNEIFHAPRVEGRRRVGHQEHFFDRHGDAVKRSPALAACQRVVRFPRARARICFEHLHDGVQLVVVRGDAREERVCDFGGRDFTIANPSGELGGRRKAHFRGRSHRRCHVHLRQDDEPTHTHPTSGQRRAACSCAVALYRTSNG
jgi:hypothetical protein